CMSTRMLSREPVLSVAFGLPYMSANMLSRPNERASPVNGISTGRWLYYEHYAPCHPVRLRASHQPPLRLVARPREEILPPVVPIRPPARASGDRRAHLRRAWL